MATEFQPYIGPRPYERDDLAPFFGRDREAYELVSLIISSREVLFYAQSGAGKTSLLNARIIPFLEDEGFEILPLARVQGVIPDDIQPKEIQNLYIFNTLMSLTKDEANPRRLVQMSLTEFLKERKRPADNEGQPLPRALIFDQFEEIFTLYQDRWKDRNEFFKQVRDALKDDRLLRVIFTIREDQIAQLDPYASLLPEKLRTRFRLERLRRDAALSAITGPLRVTKRSFAEGVAEKLVEDLLKTRVETVTGETVEVVGEFVEPVQLQVVCQDLWQELPPDVTQITEEHLVAFGSVDRPLASFYETAINAAAIQTGIHESELRQWCEQWLITSTSTRGIVHRGPELTEGIPNEALDILEDRHLIRSEWRAGARWHELTHDRFVDPILASNKRWKEQRVEKVKNASLLLLQAEKANTINKYEQALDYAEKAYLLSEEIGDESGIVFAMISRGKAYEGQKRYEEAKAAYEQACKLSDEMGDRSGKATALQAIGNVLGNLAEQEMESDVQQARAKREKALESYEEARKLFREVDDRPREASVLLAIGDIERIRAEQEIKSDGKEVRAEQAAALECYEQARKLFHEIGDRAGEAKVLVAIGKVQQSRAERQAKLKSYGKQVLAEQDPARRSYEQARELFQKVGDSKGVDNAQQAIKNVELRKSRSRLIIILLLLFIFILGSGGILFYLGIIQPAQIQAQRHTIATAAAANATAAAKANATATAVADVANANATAIATSHYPPFTNLVLYDSLTSSNAQWDSGSQCQFTSAGYQVSIARSGFFQWCLNNTKQLGDFAYQATMNIQQGDCGGLIFRYVDSNNFYLFKVCQDGTYNVGDFVKGKVTYLHSKANKSSSAIHQGANQSNVIAVSVQGATVNMYVNDQSIDTATSTTLTSSAFNQGQIGLLAYDRADPTFVIYTNALAWTAS